MDVTMMLNTLDLSQGSSMDDVKRAFRDLSFIWHPDRQPDNLKDRATRMFQRINEAYEFFKAHPESLNHSPVDEACWAPDNASPVGDGPCNQGYAVESQICPHCQGRGECPEGVDRKGQFLYGSCPVCLGHAYLLVDPRNCCHHCQGQGKNQSIKKVHLRQFVTDQIGQQHDLTPRQYRLRYKRLWLKVSQEHANCQHCKGAGYFYFRQNLRHRTPEQSELDSADQDRRRCS